MYPPPYLLASPAPSSPVCCGCLWQEREEKLDKVSELMERNLILLGCTAIEDKLQVRTVQC